MAESTLQRLMADFLWRLVRSFLHAVTEGELADDTRYKTLRARQPLFACADQFWYYVEGNPRKSVSPDVYVLAGVDPKSAPPSWKLWELKSPPVFALEIVSRDFGKDYDQAPIAYGDTGVQELVIYDPEAPVLSDASQGEPRVRWQVWRRGKRNQWTRVLTTNADRVESESLCCWLRVVGEGDERLLRLATGRHGELLFATGEERERGEKERERGEKEVLQAALIQERRKLEDLEAKYNAMLKANADLKSAVMPTKSLAAKRSAKSKNAK